MLQVNGSTQYPLCGTASSWAVIQRWIGVAGHSLAGRLCTTVIGDPRLVSNRCLKSLFAAAGSASRSRRGERGPPLLGEILDRVGHEERVQFRADAEFLDDHVGDDDRVHRVAAEVEEMGAGLDLHPEH